MFKGLLKSLVFVSVAAGSLAASAQSVLTSIPMGGSPLGIAVNFATNRVYVAVPATLGTTDALQIIDSYSDTVIDSISVPPMAAAVAVNLFTNKVYLGGCDITSNECSVLVIDGTSNTIKKTIPITTSASAVGRNGIFSMAVNPLTGRLYISDTVNKTIDVVNCGSDKVDERISLGGVKPNAVALNPVNNRLYVAMANGTVNVINEFNNKIVATTTVGGNSLGVASDWVSGQIFATDVTGQSVSVLDTKGAFKSSIPVGAIPFAVDADFISHLTFATDLGSDSVSVIDGWTNTVKATVAVPTPFFIGINPANKKAYVGSQENIVVITEQ